MHPSFRSVMIVCLAGLFSWRIAHGQQSPPQGEDDSRSGPAASDGLRAYLDPATGRLIDHPPYGKSTLKLQDKTLYMFSTDHFGLIEERLPDGTLKVDLQGRFRVGSVATVDESGEVHTHRVGGEMFLSPAGRRIHELIRTDNTVEEPDR